MSFSVNIANSRFPQVNWLNAFLQQGWPSLNEAASKAARESLDGILKQYQPDAIELMRVKSLDLGEVPPVFKGMSFTTPVSDCLLTI